MQGGVDADRGEGSQIQVLNIAGARLQDHLKLVIMLETVGVFAIAAVLGAARRLHIGGLPRLFAKRAQGGGGMEGAGADSMS